MRRQVCAPVHRLAGVDLCRCTDTGAQSVTQHLQHVVINELI